MVRTRTGIRSNPLCVALGGTEKHRDQLLASVAEVGLPLSLPVQIDGETFALRELLRDSIANFHLQQEEIPWTAIAYTLYLPPQRAWVNKLGERTTFDELAEAVIAVPPHKSSCGGPASLPAPWHRAPFPNRPREGDRAMRAYAGLVVLGVLLACGAAWLLPSSPPSAAMAPVGDQEAAQLYGGACGNTDSPDTCDGTDADCLYKSRKKINSDKEGSRKQDATVYCSQDANNDDCGHVITTKKCSS